MQNGNKRKRIINCTKLYVYDRSLLIKVKVPNANVPPQYLCLRLWKRFEKTCTYSVQIFIIPNKHQN